MDRMAILGSTLLTKTVESQKQEKHVTEVAPLMRTGISSIQAMALWMYKIYSNTENKHP